MKICTHCLEKKDEKEFYLKDRNKSVRQVHCISCERGNAREETRKRQEAKIDRMRLEKLRGRE